MTNSAPLPKVFTTVLAKGTTSAPATSCDSASSQVGQPSVPCIAAAA